MVLKLCATAISTVRTAKTHNNNDIKLWRHISTSARTKTTTVTPWSSLYSSTKNVSKWRHHLVVGHQACMMKCKLCPGNIPRMPSIPKNNNTQAIAGTNATKVSTTPWKHCPTASPVEDEVAKQLHLMSSKEKQKQMYFPGGEMSLVSCTERIRSVWTRLWRVNYRYKTHIQESDATTKHCHYCLRPQHLPYPLISSSFLG